MKKVVMTCLISGLLAGVVTFCLFYLVYPSAWFFLIIPSVMGWSIDHFVKFQASELSDDEDYNRIAQRTGLLCAAMVLLVIFLTLLPLLAFMSVAEWLFSFIGIIILGLSVYIGYDRGKQCITDAYYKSQLD